MKSVNFKRKEESYLRYFEEQSARGKKRPFNWDRFVYLILLAIFLFFTGRFVINSYFYIEGNGQVLFESVDIRHTDDIRILEFGVEEGEDVKIGDTLFTYFLDDDIFGEHGAGGFGSNSVTIGGKGAPDWIEREIYNLKKNIDLNRVQIKDDEALLAIYKNDLERVRNEVILDAVSHTNLENLEYQINKLESEINLKKEQNRIFYNQIGYLKDLIIEDPENITIQQSTNGGGSGGGNGGSQENTNFVMLAGIENIQGFKVFTSPINGNVTRIHKEPYEVALKTENILSIHQPNNVHIKGFFDQEDLRYLNEGDIVNIEFADGTKSKGIIDRFYSATYILPEEFQKKFEPTTRTLAADILPIGENDLQVWKKYYKLSVKVTKRTF